MRVVIEMSDPMRVWAIIPGGQSGHPADPHYDDQLGPWLRGDHDLLAVDFEALPGTGLRLEPSEPFETAGRPPE